MANTFDMSDLLLIQVDYSDGCQLQGLVQTEGPIRDVEGLGQIAERALQLRVGVDDLL